MINEKSLEDARIIVKPSTLSISARAKLKAKQKLKLDENVITEGLILAETEGFAARSAGYHNINNFDEEGKLDYIMHHLKGTCRV